MAYCQKGVRMEPQDFAEFERPRPSEILAGFGIRLVAIAIDFLIYVVILFLITIAAGWDASEMPWWIYELAWLVYNVGFWTWRGQTPGKMVLRLKITRTNGAPLGLGRSLLRFVGYSVSQLPFFLGFLSIALDKSHRGWHDKIAGTQVVRV